MASKPGRPATGGTRKGNGAGWGGAAKGGAAGGPAQPFAPANPGGGGGSLPGAGRGKQATEKSAARTATREQMMGVYVEVALDPNQPGMTRISAAEKWQDRTEGKPKSTANVTLNKNVRDLSTDEILAALAASGVAGEEEGSGEPGGVH